MDFLSALKKWLAQPTWESEIIISAALCLFLDIIFKKKNEQSWHALDNTATTLILAGFNMAIVIFFLNDANAYIQSAYTALHIPTLDPAIWYKVPVWIIGVEAKDFVDY